MKKINLITALLVFSACQTTNSEVAKSSAQEFIRHIPGATGVDCNETDTDNDGYVSCTVFRGDEDPMQIQCGSERICIWNCARGCKYVPMLRMDSTRRAR